MWELDDWKWLNRVSELLSEEKIKGDPLDEVENKPNAEYTSCDHVLDQGSSKKKGKKSKRSPRKKKPYSMLPGEADDPRYRKTGIKLIFKNLGGKNPTLICIQTCASNDKSFKKNYDAEALEVSKKARLV